MWAVSHKADRRGVVLCREHYSRRKPDSPQFMPPGQTLVLIRPDAVWGWWRPHPASGLKALNGKDGWTCTLFANHGPELSSRLILDAEVMLKERHKCGPDGMLTYVWREKVRSSNPGWCYKCAGWSKIGESADGKKDLLHKPFHLAGVAP